MCMLYQEEKKREKQKKNPFSVRAAICGKNILTTPAVCGQGKEANEPKQTARRLQRERERCCIEITT